MSGSNDRVGFGDAADAQVAQNAGTRDALGVHGVYHFECRRPLPEHKAEHDRLQARAARLYGAARRLFRMPFLELLGAWASRRADALRERALALTFVAWVAEAPNLVTTIGKNDILDKYLAGSAYTASFVLGLKGSGAAAAGDTMVSHAGWVEVGGANAPAYTGNRPTPNFSTAASGGVKATVSALSFSITSGGTVDGAFLAAGGSATKDTTTGTLFSAGTFSGGAKTVAASDTLNVTYQLTAT